jgi:hypothetical protein
VRECILIEVNVVDTACASRYEDKSYHGTETFSDELLFDRDASGCEMELYQFQNVVYN